jgi:hypothetical protein
LTALESTQSPTESSAASPFASEEQTSEFFITSFHMPLTMSSIPTQITTSKVFPTMETRETKQDDSDEDSCTEVLSMTSSSDTSTDARSTSFPPNTSINFPSYFLCPITNTVMIDPVIDGEGNTFERQAILRWLVLYDQVSPLTGNAVKPEELNTDTVVKGAIDKARKDAWVRYILDFEKDGSASPRPSKQVVQKETELSNSISPGSSSSSKKKIGVSRTNSEHIASKSPSKADKPKIGVEKMPSLPILVESKKKKKVTPSPPPKAPSASKLSLPPPPPPKSKRAHSNKSSHSETKSLSEATPVTQSITIPPTMSSNISACSNITFLPHNGWAVQLGVHKIICSSPGLAVTTDIHRRSTAVKRKYVDINGKIAYKDLILPPGSYVEILETQVHGGRVRGRIAWEEDEDLLPIPKDVLKKKRSFLKRKKKKVQESKCTILNGWISLQWEEEEDAENQQQKESRSSKGISNQDHRITDEDEGPWTEPIPLGVYRITFSAGLPLRETPERDSLVLNKLERGRCVEVVETQVKGDRVRARCIVPPMPNEDGIVAGKFQSGWISLLNAMTGASGAQPVPLGAYVAVAESGCVITEGGRLDSKVRGNLSPGSCIEVVATRIEEGVVRGLIAAGGHVTLFVPTGKTDRAGTQRDGGRMFAMPVPLGTYQIIQNGVNITTGISSASPVSVKLKQDACAEIVETRVEDGRVRGRISAVGYGGISKEARGWIDLFEPTCRWAKIVCFQGGRPIGPQC